MSHRSLKQQMDEERGEFVGHMTSGEICSFLNISPRVFRARRAAGKIPEPAARSASGWGLWSPAQTTALLQQEIDK